jgi:hypothetical protein
MERGNDRLFEPALKQKTDAVQPRKHELLVEVLRFVTAALFRLSWNWRERSSVKIAERTYEERAQALHC